MFLRSCCLAVSLLSSSLGSTSVIQHTAEESKLHALPQERALPILVNPSSLGLFNDSAIDAATIRVQTSSGNALRVKCNAQRYGAGLSTQSCFSALRQSPTGNVEETWSYSSAGLRPDVELPVELFSGKRLPPNRDKHVVTV